MQACVFPSPEKAAALKFWRGQGDDSCRRNGQLPKDTASLDELDDTQFWKAQKEFWFDYISDTGDGMKATYSIAYLCLSDLYVQSHDSETPVKTAKTREPTAHYETLPRGAFLFIGGDTAYHMSDYMTLANRVQLPFQWAYEDLLEDQGISDTARNRPLFGIPGNHDYYDQLDGFRRQFRQPIREEPLQGRLSNNEDITKNPQLFIPGFNRRQEASYVALQLPFDWWFWGLDTEVGQIDERQRKFFRSLCKQDPNNSEAIIPPEKLIIATCAPTTVFGKVANPNDGKAADAMGQLGLSQPFMPDGPRRADGTYDLNTTGDAKLQEGQCRLDISGDVHHYARYWGPKSIAGQQPRPQAKVKAPSAESYASVVSGLGGAFHHPSGTYIDEVREQVLYPTERDSAAEVARRLFKFSHLWRGGYIHYAGFILAFVIYFAAAVPQSSKQIIHNFPPLRKLDLVSTKIEPISPTVTRLTAQSHLSGTLKDTLMATANEPVGSFWSPLQLPWTPTPPTHCNQDQDKQNPMRYFYWPCRIAWPWDFTVGLWSFLLSSVLLFIATFSQRLFGSIAKTTSLGREIKPSRVEKTPQGSQIRTETIDPEIYAEPDKWLWGITCVSAFMAFGGLATIKPYQAHITPFGSSMMVLLSIIWAGAAVALSLGFP
jgi:hypothetical protein